MPDVRILRAQLRVCELRSRLIERSLRADEAQSSRLHYARAQYQLVAWKRARAAELEAKHGHA